MTNPIVKSVSAEEGKITLLLSFPKEAEYFQGHFPELAILAGVAQVHFALFYAKQYLKINQNISNIKKLRFTKIIRPDQEVFLELGFKNINSIYFRYFSGDDAHSSGNFYLKSDV